MDEDHTYVISFGGLTVPNKETNKKLKAILNKYQIQILNTFSNLGMFLVKLTSEQLAILNTKELELVVAKNQKIELIKPVKRRKT